MMSPFNKSIFLFAFIAFAQILLTNASPIFQPNEVTPPPPSSPPKVECDCAKKGPFNETTTTLPAPLMDKTIKSTDKPSVEHIGHIFIEPIGNGKEAIIIPESIHGADHHKILNTGLVTPTAALLAAKKQAILNEPNTKSYSDDDDWDTDLPLQHHHSHFNRYNDRLSNYY